ncbi:phage major capsid protein, partial [Thermodesulfobacteriota bacterium]
MLKKIKEKLAIVSEIKKRCEREGREPNSEEKDRANRVLTEIDGLDELETNSSEIRYGGPPDKTDPQNMGGMNNRTTGNGYELRTADDKKNFRSLYGSGINQHTWTDPNSTFFQALFSKRYHPDLLTRAMTEGTPSAGGFLVPVEYASKIHNVSLENELVMPMATVQPMQSNSIILPAMEIGDHSSNLYGGFTASYKGEASTLTEANPTTRAMELVAHKLTGYLRFSNELMSDVQNGEKQILDICGKGLARCADLSRTRT